MAKKIKAASHYLLILVLVGILIGFNFWTTKMGSIWKKYVEADVAGTSVSVGNVAPVVSNVCLDGYPRGGDTITVTEDEDIEIVVSATVTDSTCAEISGAKAYVFRSNQSWDYGEETTCSWNYNNCYIPQPKGGNIDCVQDSCSGGIAVYDCTASASGDGGDGMWYHVDPTNAGSSYSTTWWYAMVIASDSSGADAFASNSANTVDVVAQAAIALTNASDSIDYGSIAPGNESSDTKARGVENTGNQEINITIESTVALENSTFGNIATGQQQYGTVDFEIGDGTSLSADPVELDLVLPKPAYHTAGAETDDQIFWGIAIPAATSPGLYSGETTYSAAAE